MSDSTSLLEHLRRCLQELEAKAYRTPEEEAEAEVIRKQIEEIMTS